MLRFLTAARASYAVRTTPALTASAVRKAGLLAMVVSGIKTVFVLCSEAG
ncbi:hypothetical protein [Hymenobacter sp.]|nr:hypothetical protein [Hymenobacter sp.]